MAIDSSAKISPLAVIEDGATIAAGCEIAPFCVIGARVKLAQNITLKPHVVIAGNTQIGEDTTIYPFASIGHAPQDRKYKGEENSLIIGARNLIREHVTMNPGTAAGGGITRIGDDNLFMVGAHIGHDCQVGSRIILANDAIFGGHCIIEDDAIIGAKSAVHQFCRIGTGAIVGGFSGVGSDVAPYCTVVGERAQAKGLNLIGLKRRGASKDDIRELQRAFDTIFKLHNLSINDAARDLVSDNALVKEMVRFILADSKRPLALLNKG